MESTSWSQNNLPAQPISGEPSDDPSSGPVPRQSSLFRSYRNLPTVTSLHDSRIFLRPSLPFPSGTTYTTQYLSNDVPPFWLRRSSSVRNIPTTNSDSVISLGEASPTPNPELLGNAVPSADNYLHVDRRLFEIPPPSDTADHDNFFNPSQHVNTTRFSLDFDVLPRGVPDCHQPHPTTQRLASPRSNLVTHSDQPLLFTNPAHWTSVATQSMNSNVPAVAMDGSHDTIHLVSGINRPSQRPTASAGQARTTSAVQARLPLNARLRRVLHENRPLNTAHRPLSTETSGLAIRAPRIGNTVTESSQSPPLFRRMLTQPARHNDVSPNRSAAVAINPQSQRRHMDRRIRVVRPTNVVVQRMQNQHSEVQSSASSVEDIQLATSVTPNSRSVCIPGRRPSSQLFDQSDQSKTIELSSAPTEEAESVSQSLDWRAGCSGPPALWNRLLQTERFADIWFVVGSNTEFEQSSSASLVSLDPGAPGGPTSMALGTRSRQKELMPRIHRDSSDSPNRSTRNGLTNPEHTGSNLMLTYPSLEEELINPDELELCSDMEDGISSTRRDLSSSEHNTPVSEEAPLSKSCPLATESPLMLLCDMPKSQSFEDPNCSTHGFIRQVPAGACSFVGGSSPQRMPSPGVHTTGSESTAPQRLSTLHQPRSERFAAHRLILAIASPVFEAMFYGPAAELNALGTEQSRECHVTDIHPRAFEVMLRYIYTNEIHLDDDLDIVFYVLYAAKKYMLTHLGRRCVDHLKELITASNVCLMLDRSLFFDEEDLTRRCWHVIDVLAPNVLTSDGLLEMDATNLEALLQRDTLNCKESEVFDAVRRWAGAECMRLGIRDVLTNRAQVAAKFLHLVRFPTMTLSDFATNVAYSGFLSLEMVRDLFVHITNNNYTAVPREEILAVANSTTDTPGETDSDVPQDEPIVQAVTTQSQLSTAPLDLIQQSSISKDASLFPTEPRRGPKLWRCSRFSRTGKHAITSNATGTHQHSISFQVSAAIFLSGIGVYGSTQSGERLRVTVELKHTVLRPNAQRGFNSIGTQFHGSVETTSNETNARRQQALPRSSSLLEVARYDWRGRPQIISRRVSSQNPEPTVLTMSGEVSRNVRRPIRKRRSPIDADTMASANKDIISDGSTRVYDVTFPCPVKLLRDQRYVISVHMVQCDRPKSVSAGTLTALNASTFYIGFFGRPEVRVCCEATNSQRERPSPTFPKKRVLYRSAVGGVTTGSGRSPQRALPDTKRSPASKVDSSKLTENDSKEVVFQFWETPSGTEHGEVDRGFLPELLFYTCS